MMRYSERVYSPIRLAVVLFLALVTVGCSRQTALPASEGFNSFDFSVDSAKTQVPAGPLVSGHTFGQTFVAQHNGLTKLEVMVATYSARLPRGELVLRLSQYPDRQSNIASVIIPASTIKDNSYVTLQFAPIHDSRGKTYFLCLEARGIPPNYALTVWRSRGDVYPYGRFYVDHHPQTQDICFRAFDLSPSSSALEDSLVSSSEDARLYLIQHGERHWILDPGWLLPNGYASKQPISLPLSQLRHIPVGSCLTYTPVGKKIEIGAYTAVLFLFFFLVTYKQEWLSRIVRPIAPLFLLTGRLHSSIPLRVLLLAGFVFLIWFRAPAWMIHPHFWAEEGSTWFQYASRHPFSQDLVYIYSESGYLNLMANVGGVLSSATARIFSIEYAPLPTTIAAFLIQTLAIAIILFGTSRLFSSPWKATTGCLILLFAPTSTSEVWLNTINSMSYLGLIALLLLFEDPSESPTWVKWATRAILVLCGLSAAYSIALLPLFLLSFFRYKKRERKVQCFILAGCLLVQVGCVVFSKLAAGGLPNRGGDVTADMSSINVLFGHIAVPALGEDIAHALFGALRLTGPWLAASSFPHVADPNIRLAGLVAFLLIVGVFWLLLRRGLDMNKAMLAASFLIFAVLTCVGSLHSIPFGRYAFLPGLVFLFLLLSNFQSPGRVRSLTCMLVLAFALANGIVSYRVPPDPNEPAWPIEVQRWKADHTYKLKVWPSFWHDRITYEPN